MTDAETALNTHSRKAGGEKGDGVEILRGHAPPLLLPSDGTGVLQLACALLSWLAVVYLARHATGPSALVLGVTVVALALSARSLRVVYELSRRVSLAMRARRFALAITDDGLLFRGDDGDVPLPRDEVLAIVERGEWGGRAGRRTGDVYVVLRAPKTHVALPPVFEETPGVLAERLMRWRGEVTAIAPVEDAALTAMLPSRLYDAVAGGQHPPGVATVRHGRGWIWSGPWLTVLLGVAILLEIARVPTLLAAQTVAVVVISLAATLVLVPFAWLWLVRREIAPRRGLAFVLAPTEALMRTRGGVLRVPYDGILRVTVEKRRGTASLLTPGEPARRLLLQRKGAPDIRYDESFLGVPAEVAVALLEARKRDAGAGKPG